ncbi:tautomerase family protein [Euzebya sp.]|uniref:tautomerase family protein n=1 Tax=Euzebya sp. TaxID=1971409 RepID=UPI0035147AE6
MPLVTINLMAGRPVERIEAMIAAVSEAIAESLDTDVGTVRIVVNEMAAHQYGIGGKPFGVVQAERAAASAAEERGGGRP